MDTQPWSAHQSRDWKNEFPLVAMELALKVEWFSEKLSFILLPYKTIVFVAIMKK
jgi:hypothetical protein